MIIDPNDVHTGIDYKMVREFCKREEIEWENQTFAKFITQLRKKKGKPGTSAAQVYKRRKGDYSQRLWL